MPSLKRQKDFQVLRQQGNFIHASHWLAVSYHKNQEGQLRWAWTLPKKIGTAVTRNRLKRWGREFVVKSSEREWDVNFIFKKKNQDFYKSLSHEEFIGTFEKVFRKIDDQAKNSR